MGYAIDLRKTKKVEVPYDQIEPEILRVMIEEYITRDGTFYGEVEMAMQDKVDMVINQLKSGESAITWDLYLQTGTIILRKDTKLNIQNW